MELVNYQVLNKQRTYDEMQVATTEEKGRTPLELSKISFHHGERIRCGYSKDNCKGKEVVEGYDTDEIGWGNDNDILRRPLGTILK